VRRRTRIQRAVYLSRNTTAAAALTAAVFSSAAAFGNVPLPPYLYLDVNGAVAGSGVDAAAKSSWDLTGVIWSQDSTGESAAITTFDPLATIVLSAGQDATSNFALTLPASQATAGIVVEEGFPTISGSRLTAAGPIEVRAGATLLIASILSGTLQKVGAGTLILTNSGNAFAGGLSSTGGGVVQFSAETRTGPTPPTQTPDYVRLDAGTLRDTGTAVNSAFLHQNKGIHLGAGGGTIDIADTVTSNPHAYRGTLSGPGSLTKTGPGMLLLGPAPSTYGGATNLSQGTVKLAAHYTLPVATALTIGAAGTLEMAGFNQSVSSLAGAGKVTTAGRLTVAQSSPATWSGTISGNGGLTVAGPSFLTLAATQTYSGPTIISGPNLSFGIRLAANNALPAGAALHFNPTDPTAAPKFDLNGFNQTLAAVVNLNPAVGLPSITNTAATQSTLTLNPTTTTPLAVPLDGALSLVKTGNATLTLTAPNAHSGPTRVAAGTLLVSHPAQLGDGSPTNTLVLDGGTLRVSAPLSTHRPLSLPAGGTINTDGFDAAITGPIIGNGTLTKTGGGTLSLIPQPVTSLNVTGGQVRLLPVGGTATVGAITADTGRLDLSNNRAVFPAVDPSTVAGLLATARTPAGDWQGAAGVTSSSAANDPAQRTALAYATAAQLGVTSWGTATNLAGPEVLVRLSSYGDLNLDGTINGDDYARLDRALARHLPAGTAAWIDGDVNYDRSVTAADYLLIDRAFALQGNPLSPSFLATRESRFGVDYVTTLLTSVPEPSMALLAFAMTVTTGRRRRH
jgi:autotransporter-associated beta strand protein